MLNTNKSINQYNHTNPLIFISGNVKWNLHKKIKWPKICHFKAKDSSSNFTASRNIFIFFYFYICLIVFKATFNTISVILWQSVLLVEETVEPGENHRPVANHWQTLFYALIINQIILFLIGLLFFFICEITIIILNNTEQRTKKCTINNFKISFQEYFQGN